MSEHTGAVFTHTSKAGIKTSVDPKTLAVPLKIDETAVQSFVETGELPAGGFFEGLGWHQGSEEVPWMELRVEDGVSDPRPFANSLKELVTRAGSPITAAAGGELNDWLEASKIGVYYILMSPEYNERAFFEQVKDATAFSEFLRLKNSEDAPRFLRLITLELWLRAFFDEPEVDAAASPEETTEEVKVKLDTEPNEGKNLDINVNGVTYRRYPLRTKNIERNDSLESVVAERVADFLENTTALEPAWWDSKWQVFISEKIVAITQSRSFYVWEIEPGWWARKLSARITPSSYGYGLSVPWTMQLAINEVGLPRILLASAGSVLGKIFKKAGVFYMIAGAGVRAIDGPLESPVYPSFLSAKLAPSDTSKAAKNVAAALKKSLPEEVLKNFAGVVIIDANDVGRHILGKSNNENDKTLEAIFDDNPLGQGGERTPVCVVTEVRP